MLLQNKFFYWISRVRFKLLSKKKKKKNSFNYFELEHTFWIRACETMAVLMDNRPTTMF